MRRLTVIYKDPKALKPRATNPRTHSKKQIKQIKNSIHEFGFVRPILLDSDDRIIAGHGSTLAAIELGMADIPTVRVDHLSPAQRLAQPAHGHPQSACRNGASPDGRQKETHCSKRGCCPGSHAKGAQRRDRSNPRCPFTSQTTSGPPRS